MWPTSCAVWAAWTILSWPTLLPWPTTRGFIDYGYRNHTQFAITADGQLAYRRAFSHDLIPIDRCLLLDSRLDDLHGALDVAWPELQAISLRTGINTGDALVLFEAAGAEEPELEIDLPASCALLHRSGPQAPGRQAVDL